MKEISRPMEILAFPHHFFTRQGVSRVRFELDTFYGISKADMLLMSKFSEKNDCTYFGESTK
jgi:hypothetical protein